MQDRTKDFLREGRGEHHRFLASFPGTTGTAIGFKRRAGKKTSTPAIIVYVRHKRSSHELKSEERLPSHVQHKGRKIAIDVWPIPKLRYEFGAPPWFCRDSTGNPGTISMLCRNVAGEVFGLTCSHCIKGIDNDPATPDPVELWDPGLRDYLPIGVSGPYADTSGLGLPGNFGFSDWGLFTVQDPAIIALAQAAQPLAASSPALGATVASVSAHGPLQGVVEHVEIQMGDYLADVAIYLTRGATFGGDSGTLWRDRTGSAVAIHAMGIDSPTGSTLSVGMSAARVISNLRGVGFEALAA